MPHDHGVKYSRNQTNMTLDSERLHFFFTRDPDKYNPANHVIETLLADERIKEFLERFWDSDPAVRYVKMLQHNMENPGEPILTEGEVALYVIFVEKGELTEDEFLDNFTPIYSTLFMHAGESPDLKETNTARLKSQMSLMEEIRHQREVA